MKSGNSIADTVRPTPLDHLYRYDRKMLGFWQEDLSVKPIWTLRCKVGWLDRVPISLFFHVKNEMGHKTLPIWYTHLRSY